MSKIEEAFRGLGRTEKAKFISQNIDYANADAVAKYTSAYLFDVLNDINDLVNENMKKMEKQRTKEGLPPQKITNQANQSTKNINTKIDKGSSNTNAEERARKVEESYQNARNAKPGSITAKANMVRDFDERNKKK